MAEPQAAALFAIKAAWIAWVMLWIALSFGVKPTQRHESRLSRALHIVPLAIASALLFDADWVGPRLRAAVLPRGGWMVFAGLVWVLAGLGYSVWARLAIGANWSGTVTVKRDHALITHGPYALVRHPIYTGLLAAFLGTAMAMDAWRGVLAFGLVAVSFLRKIRTEEAFMVATFGDAYCAYRARTAALVPWIW